MNHFTTGTSAFLEHLSALTIAVFVASLLIGCADIQDTEYVDDDNDDNAIPEAVNTVDYDCVGPCLDEDDDFTFDRFADLDVRDIDYPLPGDGDGNGSDSDGDGDGSDGDGDGDGSDGDGDGDGSDGDGDGDGSDGDGDGSDGDGDDGAGYCDLDANSDTCPSSHGYWSNHEDQWPISPPDDCSGSDEEGCLCGMTYAEILDASTAGDTWMILARQWVAAVLNAGIDACDAETEEYLLVGEALLESCSIASDNEADVLELAARLDLFNNGELTDGCSD